VHFSIAGWDIMHDCRVARVLRHDTAKTQLALGHFRPLFPDVRPLFGHSLFTFKTCSPLGVLFCGFFIVDLA
jgi:hypothetical protein